MVTSASTSTGIAEGDPTHDVIQQVRPVHCRARRHHPLRHRKSRRRGFFVTGTEFTIHRQHFGVIRWPVCTGFGRRVAEGSVHFISLRSEDVQRDASEAVACARILRSRANERCKRAHLKPEVYCHSRANVVCLSERAASKKTQTLNTSTTIQHDNVLICASAEAHWHTPPSHPSSPPPVSHLTCWVPHRRLITQFSVCTRQEKTALERPESQQPRPKAYTRDRSTR